jgi:hypothetical protein
LEYRQLHLPVFLLPLSFDLWLLLRFGDGFAPVALLVLMVVMVVGMLVVMALLLVLSVAKPLLTVLQTKCL